MGIVLGVDPGTEKSGWCIFAAGKVLASGVQSNSQLILRLQHAEAVLHSDMLAIEMVASYGMAVGREVFETCVWIGRFRQAWRAPDDVRLVYRREVKLHLCDTVRATDANIREALVYRFGPVGTKAKPGPLYGVSSHAWAALGVAVTADAI